MEDSCGLSHHENLDSTEPRSTKKPFKTFPNMFEKLAPSLKSIFQQKDTNEHCWYYYRMGKYCVSFSSPL